MSTEMNRHERHRAEVEMRKESAKLTAMNLDELLEDTMKRVRTNFVNRKGKGVNASFVCITRDGELFAFPGGWTNDNEKAALRNSLIDTFRARHVIRYAHVAEVWTSTPKAKVRPSADPDRKEAFMITAVERGAVRNAMAFITRQSDGTAALGDWDVSEKGEGWLLNLLDDDKAQIRIDDSPVALDTEEKMKAFIASNPEEAERACKTSEVLRELREVLKEPDASTAIVAANLAYHMIAEEADQNIAQAVLSSVAQTLRNNPDKFPPFGVAPPQHEEIEAAANRLAEILDDLEEQDPKAIAMALLNIAMDGAPFLGALPFANYLDHFAKQ